MSYSHKEEWYDSSASEGSWDFSDYAGMGQEGEDGSDCGEEAGID